MRDHESIPEGKQEETILIHGARYAIGSHESARASIRISRGRIDCFQPCPPSSRATESNLEEIDLSGFLVMPGLVNSHDHLEFSLFPRLADPPYRNYIDWGDDIHSKFPDIIARYRAVPKNVRLWWGGIRNLLCGVTTVSHHDPLWSGLERKDFPVRVILTNGSAHSLALGGDLCMARVATPKGRAFVLHACEGVDQQAREELWILDELGLLDESIVLVHGLAIDGEGVALMIERRASLIVCPSSNYFLFEKLPNMAVLGTIDRVALGNDSPLTAAGDLLDEIRFTIDRCRISPERAYRMVTTVPAELLRLKDGEGSLRESGVADLIAVRDTGPDPADRLQTLSMDNVEFVMIGGRVQLASELIFEKLSPSVRHGLEPLSVGAKARWLRAPVRDLLRKTEEVLGKGEVRLGRRPIRTPASVEAQHVS